MKKILPIILSGGSGTRLWPSSRGCFPKQYLLINNDEKISFLQKTVQRLKVFETIDADIVWVSLGFPKQEVFIDNLCNEIELSTNFVGIGAVFDWVAGTKKKAPEWVANLGLEWVLRFVQEPTRLFKRYLIDNTLFILYFLRQVFFKR